MRPILVLVALLLVVTACSDSAADPVEVTGTEVCSERVISPGEPRPFTPSDGSFAFYECEDKTSDPRVSGVGDLTVVMLNEPPTGMFGNFELVNDGGTWVGDWTGEITQSQNHIMDAVLVGTGEYEGLEYEEHWEGVDQPLTITGTIRASE